MRPIMNLLAIIGLLGMAGSLGSKVMHPHPSSLPSSQNAAFGSP
jgi:hypothetical protein